MYVEVPDALRENRLAGPPNPAITAWLGAIPSLVEAAAERWALTLGLLTIVFLGLRPQFLVTITEAAAKGFLR